MEIQAAHSSGGGGGGAFLAWEDITVVLPNTVGNGPTRRLLNGVNGYAQPGRITAVMGPSGSGKSTLLDSLSGRVSATVVMTGKILVNGKKRQLDYGGVAYVAQENTLLGTLTVRETITYSANLRLPSSLTRPDIEGIVEGTILEMGLQDCADRLIGNWHLRGVSGGEKKRLNIALEILTRPQVLILDEPTSGLDSAASFFVVHLLKCLALDQRTIVSSIHQPSSETFALFDDLFLLSGGETVYFGKADNATEFFAEVGFPCPSRRNPSDHFLRCINSDFDQATSMSEDFYGRRQMQKTSDPLGNMETDTIKATLVEKYKWSEYARRVRTRIQEISTMKESQVESKRRSQATWWKQLSTLTKRSSVNMSRDIGYYWVRLAVYIALALSVGTIFYDVGTSYSAILARGSCGNFMTGVMITVSVGCFPSFVEEMKVFTKERHNGYYGVAVYIASNYISSFPYLVVMAAATGSISFYMVKFRKEFSHFAFYCLNIFGCIAAVESLMMVVASLVPNYLMGLITGLGILGIMMVTSGFFRLLSDLPKLFWRYPISYEFPNLGSSGNTNAKSIHHVSCTSDTEHSLIKLQGFFKNDLMGLEFDPLVPGDPKLKGSVIIRTMFGIPMDHSKWWDLAAVYIILLSYRILFFLVIKFKERAAPLFKTLYTKKIVNQLKNRASFRKSAFPSTRLQPSYPLHVQEGLSSPIQ